MSEPYLKKQEFDLLRDQPTKSVVEKIPLHLIIHISVQQLPVTQQQLIITEEATEVDTEPFVSSKIYSVF